MSCSLLFKIVSLCGIFYSVTKQPTNDNIVAATFHFKDNVNHHITLLNDANYTKCFPTFKTKTNNAIEPVNRFYKKDNHYLIIDEEADIYPKCLSSKKMMIKKKAKKVIEKKNKKTPAVRPVSNIQNVTEPVNVTNVREIVKEVKEDVKEKEKVKETPEKKDNEDEDDDEDDDHWKKYVHHSLHKDVEHYIKNDHRREEFKNKRPVHFLKKKIKEWWDDEEEDDETDVKRMKHFFRIVRKN
jgi:hypothetical protein